MGGRARGGGPGLRVGVRPGGRPRGECDPAGEAGGGRGVPEERADRPEAARSPPGGPAAPREAAKPPVGAPEVLTREGAVRIATVHNRDYLSRREGFFLSAL